MWNKEINPIQALYPWHPLTKVWIIPSFPTKHTPVYRIMRGIAWSLLVSSFCSEAICSSFVSSASSPGNFQKQLEISCTNNNQPQLTNNPNQPIDQPTANQSSSTSWVDAVVLASNNATSFFLGPWFDVASCARRPEDMNAKMCLASCCSVCSFKCFTKSSMSAAWKISPIFSAHLFFRLPIPDQNQSCENSPNQSSLFRQVEVFLLMILPKPSSKSQVSQALVCPTDN